MTEIMPFPENNCETVLLDRPFGRRFCVNLQSVIARRAMPDVAIRFLQMELFNR